MRKILPLILLFACVLLQNCTSSKKAMKDESASTNVVKPTVFYEANILPIIQQSCMPCHSSSSQGLHLDSYLGVKEEIDDVIYRISLPQNDPKFMPKNLKKPALTIDQINMIKKWKAENMTK